MDAKEIQEALQVKLDEFKGKVATPDQIESLKSELNEQIKGLKVKESLEGVKSEFNEQIEALKSEIEAKNTQLDEVLEKQGEELAKRKTSVAKVDISNEFEEKYKELGGGKTTNSAELFSIKAWDSADTVTFGTVDTATYGANGSPSNVVGADVYSTQVIPGIWAKKRAISKVMQLVNRIPLNGSRLVTMSEKDIVGDAEFTLECGLKPIVKINYEATESKAEKIAAFYKTTEEIRKFLPMVVSKYKSTVGQLVSEKLPRAIMNGDTETGLKGIKDYAGAFTIDPALKIHVAPNNYDSIGALIASLEARSYYPNTIMMHPFAWRAMKQNKESDGHYNLSNGSSIQILNDGIEWDNGKLTFIKDETMGVDDIFVGDLEVVYVAMDGNISYREGFNNDGDMRRNLLAHVNETFLAVAIPEGATAGLVYDTFSNVKTLLTA